MRVPFTSIRAEYVDTPERRALDLRLDGLSDVPLLGWCRYSRARPDLPRHHHPGVLEVHLLQRGHVVFEVEGRPYMLHGGDAFVTQPGERHSTGGEPIAPCVLYWLNLRLPKRDSPLLDLPLEESAALIQALRSISQRQFRAGPRLKGHFDRLLELHDHSEARFRSIRIRQAAVELFLELIDRSQQPDPADHPPGIEQVARAIRGRPGEDFRMKDLARMAGLSLSWFKARFKEELGISPRQFILRTRIEAACERLCDVEESISKIAMELGFPTSQYFATVFRRVTGVSPTQYRRNGIATRGPSRRAEDGQT